MQKKAAHKQDWHRADIVATLHKCGWSLRRLSTHHGYQCATTLNNTLDRPWPRGERLIADVIGIAPERIWPSRYARATPDEVLKSLVFPPPSSPVKSK